MTKPKTDLLQGTLDLLILRALTVQADHGLGITRRLSQITKGTLDVKPGSLFPALHRLEEKGWLASQWGRVREPQASEVLLAHGGRPTADRNGASYVAPRLRCDRLGHQSHVLNGEET